MLASQLCVRGLGSCAPGRWLFVAGASGAMIFSGFGRIRVVRCRKCSIRLRFTGRL